ncbi:MAG: hypothetical protein ACOCYN_00480, partial [Planctomycetota bacterium]
MGRLTRRARIRLVIAVIVLGLPVLAGGVAVWFVVSGALQRRIEQAWSEELPGRLEIGTLAVDALDTVVVEDSGVHAGTDGAPVFELAHALIRGSVLETRVGDVALRGLRLDASPRNHPFLLELGEEIHRLYREMEVHPRIRVELDDAVVLFDDTPLLDAATLLWDNREDQRQIALRAQLAQGSLAFTGALGGSAYVWRLDATDIVPEVLLEQVLGEATARRPVIGLLPERLAVACAGRTMADGSLRVDLQLDAPALGLAGLRCSLRAGPDSERLAGDFALQWQQGSDPLRGSWAWASGDAGLELTVASGVIPVSALCDALAGLGMMPRLGRLQRLMLPRELDCSGSQLVVDLVTGALAGQLAMQWRAPLAGAAAEHARISADWRAADGVLVCDRLTARIPGLVRLEQLAATVDARHAGFSWSQLELDGIAGDLLAARTGLALADWIALTPRGSGRIEQDDHGLRFDLTGEAPAPGAHWQVSGDGAGVARISGERLPAHLFADWLAPWQLRDGLAQTFHAQRAAAGWRLEAAIERGRLEFGAHALGWSGPLKAVLPSGPTAASCSELQLRSARRDYSLVLRHDDSGSTLDLAAAELTDFLVDARLALPLVLDGFAGRLAFHARWPDVPGGAPAAMELEWSEGVFGQALAGLHARCRAQARPEAGGYALALTIDAGRMTLRDRTLDLGRHPVVLEGVVAPAAGPPLTLTGAVGAARVHARVQAF